VRPAIRENDWRPEENPLMSLGGFLYEARTRIHHATQEEPHSGEEK
jgi:hypothetical protein